jgi:predicted esterase
MQGAERARRVTRRGLLALVAVGAAAVSTGCATARRLEETPMHGDAEPRPGQAPPAAGRLRARLEPPQEAGALGLVPLGLDGGRDGLLYVPAGYQPESPAPFVLMLHGAGGNAHHGLAPFLDAADQAGLILLAPDSRRQTWDVLMGGFGPDAAFIDRALTQTFRRYSVDPTRLAVEGFSDGASYALSLGITNGHLFTHVIAFSPGFAAPAAQVGEPRLFISHGVHDAVLPIDACSRRIVPLVQRAGYDVVYHEFDGGHAMPPDVVHHALAWFEQPRA